MWGFLHIISNKLYPFGSKMNFHEFPNKSHVKLGAPTMTMPCSPGVWTNLNLNLTIVPLQLLLKSKSIFWNNFPMCILMKTLKPYAMAFGLMVWKNLILHYTLMKFLFSGSVVLENIEHPTPFLKSFMGSFLWTNLMLCGKFEIDPVFLNKELKMWNFFCN